MPRPILLFARPFRFLGGRLIGIFRDEPSWAEFFSSVAIMAFVLASIK